MRSRIWPSESMLVYTQSVASSRPSPVSNVCATVTPMSKAPTRKAVDVWMRGVDDARDDADAAERGEILVAELDRALHGAVGICCALQSCFVAIGRPLFEAAAVACDARRECQANRGTVRSEYFVHACRPPDSSVTFASQGTFCFRVKP